VSHANQDLSTKMGGVLARLNYANVAATLALAVALGGTATAATLGRDSVGSGQIQKDAVGSSEIRKDAVRSPEIKKDAVRSPEIQAGAVRSSEIRDGSIFLADISASARTALAKPPVVAAENDQADVPFCGGPLTNCSNLLSVRLTSGNWLVQAKFVMRNDGNPATRETVCGLVQSDTTVLDEAAMESLDVRGTTGSSEAAALTGVLTGVPNSTRVALRCTEGASEHLVVDDVKITALEVGSVTGP
jgi:hypothetical protein